MIHLPGSPRSALEKMFVLEALACPKCGTHAIGDYKYRGGTSTAREGGESIVVMTCPKCGTVRELHFHERHRLTMTPAEYELGGAEPSTVLDPGQFMAEHDRVAQLVHDIPPADPVPGIDAIVRVMTALVELGKFIPRGAEDVPAAAFWTEAGRLDLTLRPTRYRRGWLDAQNKKYAALEARYIKAAAGKPVAAAPTAEGKLDAAALQAHHDWVKRGGKGAGRLELRGVRAPNVKLGPAELSGAILRDCVLDGADVSYGTLDQARLERVSLKAIGLASTSLAGAVITGCDFTGAGMVLAKLGDAKIDGTTFANAELDRSTWYRTEARKVDLRGARFGNAALDRAVFTECNLRGATLALLNKQPLGSTFQTRFVKCDLRDTTWADRDLADAHFIDCKLDGARGKPSSVKHVVLERAELGSRRLDGHAALAALGWT